MLKIFQIFALIISLWAFTARAGVTTLDCPVARHVQLEPPISGDLPAPEYQYQFSFDSAGGSVDAKETNFGSTPVREERWSGDATLTPSIVTISFRGRFTTYAFQIDRSNLSWTGLASMPGFFKRRMSGLCKISKLKPRINKF